MRRLSRNCMHHLRVDLVCHTSTFVFNCPYFISNEETRELYHGNASTQGFCPVMDKIYTRFHQYKKIELDTFYVEEGLSTGQKFVEVECPKGELPKPGPIV